MPPLLPACAHQANGTNMLIEFAPGLELHGFLNNTFYPNTGAALAKLVVLSFCCTPLTLSYAFQLVMNTEI